MTRSTTDPWNPSKTPAPGGVRRSRGRSRLGRRDVAVAVDAGSRRGCRPSPSRSQLLEHRGACPVGAGDRLEHDLRRLRRGQDADTRGRRGSRSRGRSAARRARSRAAGGTSWSSGTTRARPGRRARAGRGPGPGFRCHHQRVGPSGRAGPSAAGRRRRRGTPAMKTPSRARARDRLRERVIALRLGIEGRRARDFDPQPPGRPRNGPPRPPSRLPIARGPRRHASARAPLPAWPGPRPAGPRAG